MTGVDPVLDRLVAGNDVDELVREVDRRTAASDWDGLLRLRDRCRSAVERGFQLWPAASLAEYRLALRAPGPWWYVWDDGAPKIGWHLRLAMEDPDAGTGWAVAASDAV